MRLQAEVILILFFRLVHLWLAGVAVPVLRRRRRSNQRGIYDDLAQHQALLSQVRVDHLEDVARQTVALRQPTELQKRLGVRRVAN